MPHGLFGPIAEDDKWGAKKWVAYAFFFVVKGCCPGEDVRSPLRSRLRFAVSFRFIPNCNN